MAKGSEVLVMGVRAGWIDDISVQNGRLLAIAKIEGEFRDFIRTDSVARLTHSFVVGGETLLEIENGTGPPLAEGSVIAVKAPQDFLGQIEEMVAGIQGELQPGLREARDLMGEWRQLASELRDSQQNLSNLLVRVDRVTAEVEAGEGTVGRLLRDPSLAEDLDRIVKQANVAMSDLRRSLDNIEAGTERLPEIGDTLASEARDLPMLTLQAQQTLREIETFFAGLQRHWLVRRAMDADEDPPPRIPPAQIEGRRR
ncbi:MAG: MlaD family protein [Limisphaerales bacterium]